VRVEPLDSRALLSATPLHLWNHVPAGVPHHAVHAARFNGATPVHGHQTVGHHARPYGRRGLGTVSSADLHATPVSAPALRPGDASPFSSPASAPYTPAQVRHAYGFDQVGLNGAGQVIAIVDAYDDPTIANDLHTFDQVFGLPDPVLTKAFPGGGTPAYNAGWASEIALDVEWAHAIAPNATILLVEATSASLSDLLTGVDYAVAQGATQVSMSWGSSEFSGESTYDGHFQHPGVTFLAASGDTGAGVSYPAASPYVTAVGGTTLQIDSTTGNWLSESAWSGSGGGSARLEWRPGYQYGFQIYAGRGVPDVAYNADPNTGYYVYDSSSGGAWYEVGGTSAGPPQWAGLVALANQGRASAGRASLGSGYTYGTNQILYSLAGGTSYTNPWGDFYDVTTGSNGYPATVGYDRVTGLGSPVANRLVPDLVNA
jgi:subtilase family serine protease